MSRPSHYNSRHEHGLTPQQQRVLELVADGRTNAEIADHLDLSLDGAKWHVREVLARLGVDSREEAAAWWRRHQQPGPRLGRALTAIPALLGWKSVAVIGGAGALSAVAVAGALTFRGGFGASAQDSAAPAACTAANMRWETSTESVGEPRS